jgi:CRP-like cAMP-binding protein
MGSLPEKKIRKLRRVIDNLIDVPDEEWVYFSDNLAERTFDKGRLLFQAGEPVTDFFFINKGLVRFFYLTEDGKEFNKAFAMENDFVGSFSAKNLGIPSRFSVQALEETEAVVIPVRIIEAGYDLHPCWERLGRLHAERVAVLKEMREAEFLLDSAETRYNRLLAVSPAILERVNQYHIASYLGITDVALSRIRQKIGLTGVRK